MDNTKESKVNGKVVDAVRIVSDFVKGNENILLSKGDNCDVSGNPMKTQCIVSKSTAAVRMLLDYIAEKTIGQGSSRKPRNYRNIRLGINEDGSCLFEIGLNDTGFYVSLHESMFDDGNIRKMWYGRIWRCEVPVIP